MSDTLLIVGAGPGLGSAMAKRFAEEGWSIGLVARREEVLKVGEAELRPSGVPTCGAIADVVDAGLLKNALRAVHDALGVPKVVVYNASLYQAEPALELSMDALKLALDVHVIGALNTVQSAVPLMRAAGRGVLVFTINRLAREPQAASTAMSIGKGAQLNLALSLELELEGTGIDVGIVTIGGPIEAGTAFDPSRIAEVYWQLARQRHDRFQRDFNFDGVL